MPVPFTPIEYLFANKYLYARNCQFTLIENSNGKYAIYETNFTSETKQLPCIIYNNNTWDSVCYFTLEEYDKKYITKHYNICITKRDMIYNKNLLQTWYNYVCQNYINLILTPFNFEFCQQTYFNPLDNLHEFDGFITPINNNIHHSDLQVETQNDEQFLFDSPLNKPQPNDTSDISDNIPNDTPNDTPNNTPNDTLNDTPNDNVHRRPDFTCEYVSPKHHKAELHKATFEAFYD